MNDINKHCEDNLGGIYLFKFIPITEVASIPEAIISKVCEPLVIAALGRWYDCYGTEGTMKFNEEMIPSPHGNYHNVKLSSFIPRDRTDVSDLLDEMKDEKFIIDCWDNNGHRKLIGTLTEPLQFKYSLDTGSAVPNRNGYTIEFYGNIIKKAPTYFI